MDSEELTFIKKFELAIKPHNDGSLGLYRAPVEFNISGVNTDGEAIAAFLSQYKHSPATLRTYTKEAERFHMWVILKLNKSIPDMSIEDYQAYVDFLSNPDADWISEVKVPKDSAEWRPFTFIKDENPKADILESRGLSKVAVQVAVSAISSMLSWMVDAGYIRLNPLKILRQKNKAIGLNTRSSPKKVSRFLDAEMFQACLRAVESMPKSTVNETILYERMRFILTMFVMIGARVSELSNAQMNGIAKEIGGWFWNVVGKGQKEEKVPVPQDMIDGLIRWRKALKLSELPNEYENIPVIPALNKFGEPLYTTTEKQLVEGNLVDVEVPRHGLSPRRINTLLKEVFHQAAKDSLLSADRKISLNKASAHWLRHTSVTQKIQSGMDRHMVQKDARHSDIKTTDLYNHDEEIARSIEAQKHKLKWK